MPHPISDHARGFVPASITDYLLAHAGRPAIVIGGGPSVPWYFSALSPSPPPPGALVISANAHGCRLAEFGIVGRPDYIVCIDDNLEDEFRPYRVPIVTQRDYSDIQLWRKPVHSSGQLGCYVAWLLGCAPIIPYGMDLYAGGAKAVYFGQPRAQSAGVFLDPGQHFDQWKQLLAAVPDDVVRVPSGCKLAELFKVYDSRETFEPATARAVRLASAAGYSVRFLRQHPRLRGRGHWQVGDVAMMTAKDARRLQREHVAQILDTIPETA